ncbi:MAG: amidohydrolase [Sphingobacteriales bacterium]|nr:amidohydrolase [Sphingobacteriales bacterium]
MHITLLQTDLIWEQAPSNLSRYAQQLAALPQPVDMIVLPEMWQTGFSMNAAQLAETEQGKSIQAMLAWAHTYNAAVAGSLIIAEDGQYYNRFICAMPDGTCHQYDKRHLFRMGGEGEVYTAGKERIIIEYRGWRIAPFVCYDLRFPVWSRRQVPTYNYDLLLYVANWPARRSYAWSQLLIARAIENQSYVVGVNRIGNDGNDIYHNGSSAVIDPQGKVLWTQQDQAALHIAHLDKTALDDFRAAFPAYLDADAFELPI